MPTDNYAGLAGDALKITFDHAPVSTRHTPVFYSLDRRSATITIGGAQFRSIGYLDITTCQAIEQAIARFISVVAPESVHAELDAATLKIGGAEYRLDDVIIGECGCCNVSLRFEVRRGEDGGAGAHSDGFLRL